MNKKIVYGLILILAVFIIGSVAEYLSYNSATKYFDNGKISFNYPASMNVTDELLNNSKTITIYKSPNPIMIYKSPGAGGTTINIHNYGILANNKTFDDYITKNISSYSNQTNISNKFTIDGRSAYNITIKNRDGSIGIITSIDLGNNTVLYITTFNESNAQNQTLTDSYKAYTMIVQSIKINI
jgi:PBP1b-binding outer membrane lipoprotein LpoB